MRKRTISLVLILVMLLMPIAARADFIKEIDPVELELTTPPSRQLETKRLEERMNNEYARPVNEQPTAEVKKGGSSWWKWALGILVIGGIAAAAGGGGGSGSSGGGTTTVNTSW